MTGPSVDNLLARARQLCDADGKTRLVIHTSLGWRIETQAYAGDTPDGPYFRVYPRTQAKMESA